MTRSENATLPAEKKLFPVQRPGFPSYGPASKEQAKVWEPIYRAAYEVYSAVYGQQQDMIEGGCRGGFSTGELIVFLYARTFPKQQWRDCVESCFNGGIQNL